MEFTMEQIRQIINEAAAASANATVLKLKAAGLILDNTLNAYQKTECLLSQYKTLKSVNEPYARRVVEEIDACLVAAKNEPYVDVIKLYYFEDLKNAACAKALNCDERTCRRNRRKLVERFAVRLASDEFIRELLM